jgi:vacuolar-type H+-ATPase subunit C/Vma6
MTGRVRKYAYIHAKLRARLSKLFGAEQYAPLIAATDLAEALGQLKDTEYEAIITVYRETGDIKMVELELYRMEINVLSGIRKHAHPDLHPFVDLLFEQYEVEVLEQALRFWFDRFVRGRPVDDTVSYLYRGELPHAVDTDGIIYAENPEDVSAALGDSPYRDAVRSRLPRVQSDGSLFPLEERLEGLYYRRILKEIDRLPSRDARIAAAVTGIQIDLENINRVVRFAHFYGMNAEQSRDYFLPAGRHFSTEDLAAAFGQSGPEDFFAKELQERVGLTLPGVKQSGGSEGKRAGLVLITALLSEVLAEEVRKLLYGYPFTIGIIIGYFFLKRNEIRRLRTILNAKYYRLPEERVKSII